MSELIRYLRSTDQANTFFWLNIATAVGIYGGFPRVPKVIERILKNELMAYIMTAVLIYQGGGEQNIRLAVELAIGLFVFNHVLYLFDDVGIEDLKGIFDKKCS